MIEQLVAAHSRFVASYIQGVDEKGYGMHPYSLTVVAWALLSSGKVVGLVVDDEEVVEATARPYFEGYQEEEE